MLICSVRFLVVVLHYYSTTAVDVSCRGPRSKVCFSVSQRRRVSQFDVDGLFSPLSWLTKTVGRRSRRVCDFFFRLPKLIVFETRTVHQSRCLRLNFFLPYGLSAVQLGRRPIADVMTHIFASTYSLEQQARLVAGEKPALGTDRYKEGTALRWVSEFSKSKDDNNLTPEQKVCFFPVCHIRKYWHLRRRY